MSKLTTQRLGLPILAALSVGAVASVLCVRAALVVASVIPRNESPSVEALAAAAAATEVSPAPSGAPASLPPSAARASLPPSGATAELTPPATPLPAESDAPTPSMPRPGPEEIARERDLAHQALDARIFEHSQDRIDSAWARPASERLRRAFANSSDGTTPAAEIECRSSSCVVTLKYAGAAQANANFRRLTDLPEGLNCAVYAEANSSADVNDGTARVLYHNCVR